MDKKPIVLYKTLVVGVIILFIGIAVQPSIATIQPEEKINAEPKDYLFQTIIDIANNPDVKRLLEQNKHKAFTSDYDYKGVFSQLLFKKPKLLLDLLFTKPYITYDYLDKSYNKGIEITNILGENKALEMIESIRVAKQEDLDELNNIIINNEELSDRIATLKEMNIEINPTVPLQGNLIICGILVLILIPPALTFMFFTLLTAIFQNNPTLFEILSSITSVFLGICVVLILIMLALECIPV